MLQYVAGTSGELDGVAAAAGWPALADDFSTPDLFARCRQSPLINPTAKCILLCCRASCALWALHAIGALRYRTHPPQWLVGVGRGGAPVKIPSTPTRCIDS